MKKFYLLFLLALLPLLANADPVEIDGIYYNLSSVVGNAEVTNNPNKYSGDIVIPESVTYGTDNYRVTSIGDSAFSNSFYLTSVTIPNSVTSIGFEAFSGCWGLTSITIPNSVTSIGSYAFQGTLWYINQSDGIVYAGKVLYRYKGTMPRGTAIDIEEGTLGIAGSAFEYCSSLTSITIPDGVTYIGVGAFLYCSGLTSITIPNSVTSIGEHAFDGCSGLTSLTIPNSVTSIEYSTFNNCSSLTSVTIPNSVTSIGNGAFYGCSGLANVYCYAKNVPITYYYAFSSSYISNATLHVPAGSIEAYKAAEPWNQFKEIVAIDEDNTTGFSEVLQKVGEPDVYYNLQGQRVDNPGKGLYIRNGVKVVIK